MQSKRRAACSLTTKGKIQQRLTLSCSKFKKLGEIILAKQTSGLLKEDAFELYNKSEWASFKISLTH